MLKKMITKNINYILLLDAKDIYINCDKSEIFNSLFNLIINSSEKN